ncbi:hypothetical protein PO878_00685 [Iamia majanohamensis]|uniref:Uncharacterized protein n=1 Tax=Iamia majanohamensis TaxID=467976 RepID=A0AAF0BTX7_9ACTN|nr:hypothetical protein [Iamia majanohamensis]WCO67237.1 hypothetical protein PO878_00685 [Iamia majanohamensis]
MDADTEASTRAREASAPLPPWATTTLAVALGVAAVVAGVSVVAVASGSHQLDVLGDGLFTVLVWLSLPAAVLALRRAQRARLTAVLVVALVVSIGVRLWIVRPQAPDGAGGATYEEVVGEVEADLRHGLDEVAPGGWRVLDGGPGPSRCVDRFGRDRGAVYGGPAIVVADGLGVDSQRRLAATLAAPGRQVQGPAVGTPVELRGQDEEEVVVRLEPDAGGGGSTTITVVTPCLRTGSPGG